MIFAFILITPSISDVFAEKNLVCSEGKVLVYRINSDKYACLNPSSASHWYEKGIAEPVEQIESFDSETEPQITMIEEFVIPQDQVVFENGPYQLVMVAENIYSFGNTMGSFSLVMVTDEGAYS